MSINIDPIDEIKFTQVIADLSYLTQKYGDGFMPFVFMRLLGQHLPELNEEEKDAILETAKAMTPSEQEACGLTEDQLFPFGREGQEIEV